MWTSANTIPFPELKVVALPETGPTLGGVRHPLTMTHDRTVSQLSLMPISLCLIAAEGAQHYAGHEARSATRITLAITKCSTGTCFAVCPGGIRSAGSLGLPAGQPEAE